MFGRSHPSDSDLAIQFVDWCKWLVYVASLLAPKPHLLLFFVLIGFDISKILPWCFLQTYMEEPVFSRTKKHRQQQHRIPFDAVAMKAAASFLREKIIQVSLVIKPPGLKTLGTRTMCAVALVVLGQVFLRRAGSLRDVARVW